MINNKTLFYITFAILSIVLFNRLGKQPLMLEEPRRAIVAAEMIQNDNYIVPTEFGKLYYNKPPVWNWILILSFKIFNNQSEFAVRFFSVIFLLLSGILIYKGNKIFLNEKHAAISSLMYMVSNDILFYYSFLGEIDLFYSFIILCMFYIPFIYFSRNKYVIAYLGIYLAGVIGVLTKGLPTFVFMASVVLFMALQWRFNLRKLLHWGHFVAITSFLTLITLYFFIYSKYEDPIPYIKKLFLESTEKAITKDSGRLIKHMLLFPLDTLKNLFPALIFIPFIFQKGIINQLKQNKFIVYNIYLFVANIALYWFSYNAKQRYIYMLYPLAINIIFYATFALNNIKIDKVLKVIVMIILIILSIMCIAINFNTDIRNTNLIVVSIIASLLCLGFFYLVLINRIDYVWSLIWLFIVMRLIFNYSVVEQRLTIGEFKPKLEQANEISSITQNKPLFLYEKSMCSRTVLWYVNKQKQIPTQVSDTLISNNYYITDSVETKINQDYLMIDTIKYKNWLDTYLVLIK